MRFAPIETLADRVCPYTDCERCPHSILDPVEGVVCYAMCDIRGGLTEKELTMRERVLLGWSKPRRKRRRRTMRHLPIKKERTKMKTIAVVNQKGGVAKTTTSLMLAARLAEDGERVLLIDLDSQGNLSASMPTESRAGFTSEALIGGSGDRSTLPGGGLVLIPSAASLASADIAMSSTGKEYRLKEALAPIGSSFDYCIIDTPPTLGILTINALTAADGIVVPAQADMFSLQGISQLGDTIATVRRYCNPSLKVYGVLLSRWNGRAVISREVSAMLEKAAAALGSRLFSSRIRECTALKEAAAARQSIYAYAPRSNAAADYGSFVDEIKEMLK